MPAVVFDPVAFKARYPEFAAVANPALQSCFDEAGFYLSNANNSPVQNVTRRAVLLNMLTAHIAFIGGKLSADGMPRPVGRTSNASEGSVSAGFEISRQARTLGSPNRNMAPHSGKRLPACAVSAIAHGRRFIDHGRPYLARR